MLLNARGANQLVLLVVLVFNSGVQGGSGLCENTTVSDFAGLKETFHFFDHSVILIMSLFRMSEVTAVFSPNAKSV